MKKNIEGEIRVRSAEAERGFLAGEGDGEDEGREGSAAVGEACILSKDVAQGEAAEGE